LFACGQLHCSVLDVRRGRRDRIDDYQPGARQGNAGDQQSVSTVDRMSTSSQLHGISFA
jgi:hypothetical protein